MSSNLSSMDQFWRSTEPYMKRIIEIASAGKHNLLISGSPDVGKSKLIEVLVKLSGVQLNDVYVADRPSKLYDVQAINNHRILWIKGEHLLVSGLSRMLSDLILPHVQVVLERQLCPCGYYGDKYKACWCDVEKIKRYQSRIHPSFLAMFDINLVAETSREKRDGTDLQYSISEIHQYNQSGIDRSVLEFSAESEQLADIVIKRQMMSANKRHRLDNVARTIAKMSGNDSRVEVYHVAEASQYLIER